ncbi:Ketosteroid isomerase-related protein [Nannocystis exedens]|uniref:Ketosteroid isomerase-related protein n=1 Tax=Nannocystis exedens TaxID=54 RepID=A0A1I1ZXX8_9BACT|nr:nuclear transport factor 2 family protein [Nannocystis exedens]PCC75296.1 ketosteroid isomerase [Nannocystis exedens]SFE35553.1 Ketosteroid isomerase-related protein [Nannocystis exedens]
MHPNAETIQRFYTCFAARDAAGMAACYADDVVFSDHAFPGLRGREAGEMWRMLCERGKDLKIEFRDVTADDQRGSAHWEAWYTFGTGRKVHNVVEARFEFRDGKIVRHDDEFPLWAWARQAVGLPGLVLGWTGFFERSLQRKARRQLEAFMAGRP